jgi:hypothetical protein
MGSVNVLVRATLESALLFHHLFVSPQDAAEAELRHLSWVLADLVERQAVPASLPQNQESQREERSQIDQMSAQLKANNQFQKLTTKQQKRALEDGYWSPGCYRDQFGGDRALLQDTAALKLLRKSTPDTFTTACQRAS